MTVVVKLIFTQTRRYANSNRRKLAERRQYGGGARRADED